VRNGTAVGEISGYSCQIVAEEATRWLRSREEPQKPFFLNVWFHETHEPVDSPDELVAKYPQARNRDEAEYFANVTNMDHAVGRLLETLAELHLDDNTLVFFTSDNGPETLLRYKKANRSYGSAAPLRGMKLFLYEGGIRVPGILRWPGKISPGQVDSTPVCALDLLPTFCELAGVTVPANLKLDGVSLVPWLEGKGLTRPQPLFWHYYGGEQQRQVALRDGDWKIVAWSDQPAVKGSGATFKPGILPGLKQSKLVGCELYHISTDPQETQDLAAQEPERARHMLAAAEQIYAQALAEGPDWFHELPPKTGIPLKSDAESDLKSDAQPDQTPGAKPDAKPQAVPAAGQK
jgi:arylsulfatase A